MHPRRGLSYAAMTVMRGAMSIRRIPWLTVLAAGLMALGLGRAGAQEGAYPFEIKISHSGFGDKVMHGTIVPEGGEFEQFVSSGNVTLHLSGTIHGDQVSLYGALRVPGSWGFEPFRTGGAFSGSGRFVGSIVAYANAGRAARGSIMIQKPAGAVAQAEQAPARPAVAAPAQPSALSTVPATPESRPGASTTQTAVVAPPTPEEPPLGRDQRMEIQRQLGVLGLYTAAIDGDFGPGTRKAIRQFQRDQGFEPTGYVTEPMLARLAARADARAEQLAAERRAAEELAARQAEELAAAELAARQAAEQAAQQAEQQAASAAVPEPEAPPQSAAAPEQPATSPTPASDDFAAVIATLEPIDEGFVAVKPAKVRRQPTVTGEVLETLAVGDRIDVLGRLPREDWYLVARDGQPIGYVIVSQLKAAASVAEGEAQSAAIPTATAVPPELAKLDYGRYHALVIGNNSYRKLPRLNTAVTDARAVAGRLERDYGFTVTLLTDATEEAVLGELAKLRRALTPQDNLLIYYAGHGWYDQEAERGYWLPVDAAVDNQSSWISTADITDTLKAIKAKHVMVVADSCYSGTLTRGLAISTKSPGYIEGIVNRRARTVLTSGGLEPVVDAGGGDHSVFAKAFLDALAANAGVIDGESVYQQVRERVVLNAEQTPEYGNIRLAGHDGGDFLFVRTSSP
jgi:peptidoglycan hydrolase-like protein with peptidoglycan-binding domain